MKRKKKNTQDLSMFLFSHEEMTGNDIPAPLEEQGGIPEQPVAMQEDEKTIVPETETIDHEVSDEIDSRILTKEMFFAIRHLKRLDVNQVRMLAMEMAIVWQNGNNRRESYVLQSIPDMEMDYHQFIAYYYCSFNMAFPNMMDKLQLPYEKEFQNAMYDLGAQRGGVS